MRISGWSSRVLFRSCIGQSVKFQQIAQAADYRADAEAKRVVDHQCDPQLIALHPEPPGDLRDAADKLRMVETIDDGPLGIADTDLLLGCDPDLGHAEEILRFDVDETKPISVDVLRAQAFGAGDDDDQLRLRDHAVKLKGDAVRTEVGRSEEQTSELQSLMIIP